MRRVEQRTTAVGPATLYVSSLTINGVTLASRSLAIQHDGHVSFITVTAKSSDQADRLAETVIRTVRPI